MVLTERGNLIEDHYIKPMKELKVKIVDRWREANLLTEKQNRHNNEIRINQMADEAIGIMHKEMIGTPIEISWRVVLAVFALAILGVGLIIYFAL